MRPLVLSILFLAACEPITPSGDLQGLVEARPETTVAVVPAPVDAPLAEDLAPAAAPDSFDFDADAPDDGPIEGDAMLDTGDMQEALGMNSEVDADVAVAQTEPAQVEDFAMLEAQPPVDASTPVSSPAVAPVFQPVGMGFGVRLVSTTSQSQPPRAILGLTDGREVVVEPGMMLPDEHLIVLAIGQDSIQLAEVTAMGDRAKVESRVLQAMYRQGYDAP